MTHIDIARTKLQTTGMRGSKKDFDDANAQPMPRMHKSIDWEDIQKRMVALVKAVSL